MPNCDTSIFPMTITDIHLILETVIVLGLLYLVFFKSYFHEKGKNLATKEDIQDITSTVEKIKNDLHFSTQSKLAVATKEWDAIVDFYTKYMYWLNTIIETAISPIDKKNQEVMDKNSQRIDKAKIDCDMAWAKMGLYVDDKDLSSLWRDIAIGTIGFQRVPLEMMIKLKLLVNDIEHMKSVTPVAKQFEKLKKLSEREIAIHKDSNDATQEEYKALGPLIERLRRKINDHIKKLLPS